MIAPRVETLKDIFHAARSLPAAERSAYLEKACGADEPLRREIEALLESDGAADHFITNPPAGLAGELFGKGQTHLDVGRTIGQYKLIECIGSGGMGAVYLAERADRQFQMQVAIKLIKRGMDTDSLLRRFQHERQILASLEHSNIARLLDGGSTEDGLPYFVMEYIKGLPIDRYAEEHRLSISERLELFRQVCSAVSYAHQHLVVHRDLKPSNTLVTPAGIPKLLDFGIAKIVRTNDSAEALATMTIVPIMTPEYASPEQIEGAPATTLSDVYSLGAVLYQLLTGRPPYRLQNHSPQEIAKMSTAQIEKPSAVVTRSEDARRLRGDLDNIVRMAMRKETARRYHSVEQFSEDIRRHLAGLPVIARPDTMSYRAGKFLQRNKVALSAAILILLSLVGGIIATTWQAHRATIQEQKARAEQARAERRFNDVRKLANSVLFDYHDAIKDLPGATKVRERLVRDALNYLDSLADEAHGDPDLQRELAAAYDRVGDVRGGAYLASLGDRAGGMESYQKALRIREALAAANPKDMQTRRGLAENYRRIGWQLRDTDKETSGVEHLQKALTLYKDLAAEQPENAELQDEVAATCNGLGLVFQDLGDSRSALDHFRQALAVREKFVSENPGERKYRRGLAAVCTNMGSSLLMSGDAAAGHATIGKALALAEALVAEEPTNVSHRRLLGIVYGDDAGCLDELGDKQGALESFRKSIEVYEQMMSADPANAQLYGDVGYPYRAAGDLLTESGDNSPALEYYRKSLDVYENGYARAPGNLTLRLCVAICNAGVGRLYSRLGDKMLALDESRKAVAHLLEINEEPKNATHRGLKAQTYQYLGETYSVLAASGEVPSPEAIDHWSAARDMFQRSIDIWEDMRGRGILEGPDASKPEKITRQIAKCDAFLQK